MGLFDVVTAAGSAVGEYAPGYLNRSNQRMMDMHKIRGDTAQNVRKNQDIQNDQAAMRATMRWMMDPKNATRTPSVSEIPEIGNASPETQSAIMKIMEARITAEKAAKDRAELEGQRQTGYTERQALTQDRMFDQSMLGKGYVKDAQGNYIFDPNIALPGATTPSQRSTIDRNMGSAYLRNYRGGVQSGVMPGSPTQEDFNTYSYGPMTQGTTPPELVGGEVADKNKDGLVNWEEIPPQDRAKLWTTANTAWVNTHVHTDEAGTRSADMSFKDYLQSFINQLGKWTAVPQGPKIPIGQSMGTPGGFQSTGSQVAPPIDPLTGARGNLTPAIPPLPTDIPETSGSDEVNLSEIALKVSQDPDNTIPNLVRVILKVAAENNTDPESVLREVSLPDSTKVQIQDYLVANPDSAAVLRKEHDVLRGANAQQ
jgi:hypothetical protein